MKIYRVSPLTEKMNCMDLDVTPEQLAELARPAHARRLVQEIFPDLSPAEREFVKTGYTPEDWANLFPPEAE